LISSQITTTGLTFLKKYGLIMSNKGGLNETGIHYFNSFKFYSYTSPSVFGGTENK